MDQRKKFKEKKFERKSSIEKTKEKRKINERK
jgi:hypothetical protein